MPFMVTSLVRNCHTGTPLTDLSSAEAAAAAKPGIPDLALA
jgi:hypothetical protein